MPRRRAILSEASLAGVLFPTAWKLLAAFTTLRMSLRLAATISARNGCYVRRPIFLQKLVIRMERLGPSIKRETWPVPRGTLLPLVIYIRGRSRSFARPGINGVSRARLPIWAALIANTQTMLPHMRHTVKHCNSFLLWGTGEVRPECWK